MAATPAIASAVIIIPCGAAPQEKYVVARIVQQPLGLVNTSISVGIGQIIRRNTTERPRNIVHNAVMV